MERGGRQVLVALDGLLAPGPYLRALSPLLSHEDSRVRRKVGRCMSTSAFSFITAIQRRKPASFSSWKESSTPLALLASSLPLPPR